MCTEQAVVFIADPDLAHRGLQHGGLAVPSVHDGIVMAIILQMVIVRHAQKVFVVTDCKASIGKRLHAGFVVDLKSVLP